MKEELFEKYSVPKAVMTLALPTILGMLVTVFYNMADTFCGQNQRPQSRWHRWCLFFVFMILMAFGNIFGIGGGSYISQLLGLRSMKRLKVFHPSVFMPAFLSVLLLDYCYCCLWTEY